LHVNSYDQTPGEVATVRRQSFVRVCRARACFME
jgi:hypothetical protein